MFGLREGDDAGFDERGEFVPEHLPDPGPFVEGHDVLSGDDHVTIHRTAREVFEERGVYDVTFGYNLARLNLDHRHPDAGLRYARERPDADDALAGADVDGPVLRVSFVPTTEFCPQSDTLTTGVFRAFNGERDRHEYDLVRVRVAPFHQEAIQVNGNLRQLEQSVVETGEVPGAERGPAETQDGDGEESPAYGRHGEGVSDSSVPF
jgi:hypothetical protein